MPFYQTEENTISVERQNLLLLLLSKVHNIDEFKFKMFIYNMKKEFPDVFPDYNFDAHFFYPRDGTLDGDIQTLKIQGTSAKNKDTKTKSARNA